ncbi:A/G-specific adenine glycosylase [Porphyromonas sp.]|uniref:A/G-specific adenine glycosylase n=1 Tax=Porphyromonas sp. TaxID=1924944 RepID=UPI0026DD14D6|nr:A/G-specific adenine glycosylase [Porphyromonas sp.]MDO4695132.1 A/G-specific adenine glycosylase [Porphyromonas sp.]MDO4770224.1 A/G-specific adenine glycosylase [Porphyromonas sp.]
MKSDNNIIGHHSDILDRGVVTYFRKALVKWYTDNGRKLPWRSTNDPYKIWISEVILQQTQVIQGLDYYKRFIEKYPTVTDLAESEESELLLIWQGLGYYSRAHNLHQAAKSIVAEHNGLFPREKEDVAKLKGIGPYTLAAIMSIAYGDPLAVVDGNVYRVLSRVLDLDIPIDTTTGQKVFRELAQSFLDTETPGIYNQGIMDLGAMICSPKSPKCEKCPVQEVCKCAFSKNIEYRPVKAKRVAVKKQYLDFLFVIQGDNFWAERRGKQSIWKGLYQFPLHLSETSHKDTSVLLKDLSLTDKNFRTMEVYNTTHRLTHRLLNIRIHVVHAPHDVYPNDKEMVLLPINRHSEYAFPKPLREFLDKHLVS